MIEALTNKLTNDGLKGEKSPAFTTKRIAYVIYYPEKGFMTPKKANEKWTINLQRARLFNRKSDAAQAIPSKLKGIAGLLELNCTL